ncbi:MAG: hypothetical protein KDD62_15775, partial [Bdellovibrionales bacterium]|nr:hypothetical protein [Bdellovibrionales bacterium]
YAWIAQTGVFFRRSLLEEVKRFDGTYFDEDLYYTMDFDLWLRIANHYPFTKHLDKTCAYFRMYDDNKTGKEGGPTQKECARVYRRHRNELVRAERQFSYIILVDGESQGIADTLNDIVSQDLHDSEILLTGYGNSIDAKALRSFALELDAKMDSFNIRHLACVGQSFFEACNRAIENSAGSILTFVRPGDRLPRNYNTTLFNCNASLLRGVFYPFAHHRETLPTLTRETAGMRVFSVDGLCQGNLFSSFFSAHKACLMDLEGFQDLNSCTAVRTLLLSALQKAWHIEIETSLEVIEKHSYTFEYQEFPFIRSYCTAQSILHMTEANLTSEFRQYLLREHNTGIYFEPSIVDTARSLLGQAPKDFANPRLIQENYDAEELVKEFPQYAPGWEYLRRSAEKAGDMNRAQE